MSRNDDSNGPGMDIPANERPDMDEWEAQVNALLDGELDDAQADALKAAAEADQALARAIIEAYQLQRLMTSMPVERAPDSLREKLRRIPAEQASLERRRSKAAKPPRTAWFAPRWAMALAAVPLVIAVGVQLSGPRAPSEAELAQARQDVALAFSYLAKASRATEREIEHSIGAGMRDPVTEQTVRTLNEQFDLNEEQES